jgi:diguanylate cyclase (GGDEF)-like protein/PAS domain S-box-containing protein
MGPADAAFRMLCAHAPVAQVLARPGQVGLLANAAFRQLFGHDAAELERLGLADLALAGERDRVEHDVARLLGGEATAVRADRVCVRADGSTFLGLTRTSVVPGPDGSVEYLLAAFEDVTEPVRAAAQLAESEAALRALVEASPDIIIQLRPDGGWNASNAGTQLLGYPKGLELAGGALSLVHPDDIERATAALGEIMTTPGAQSRPVEVRLRTIDGRYLDFECVGQNLDTSGVARGVVITARNITERKRMQRALRAAEAQFREVFEHAPFLISIVDLEGRIVDINYEGSAILGRTRQELIGTSATDVVHPDDIDRVIEATTRQLSGNDTAVEFRLVRSDGTPVWVMSSASLLDHGGDEEPYVVTIQADISERRALEARLEHEATRDPLTGVMNRGALMTQLELALLQRQTRLGLLFVDLDYFKSVNDTFGHEAGDAVLSTIAKRVLDSVREGDVVGRLGGDEFVVVCHDLDSIEEAVEVADRLRAGVAQPISIRGGTAAVDASVGVALARAGDDAAALMRAADKASYAAKQAGRGRVAVAEDPGDGLGDVLPIERSA